MQARVAAPSPCRTVFHIPWRIMYCHGEAAAQHMCCTTRIGCSYKQQQAPAADAVNTCAAPKKTMPVA